LPRGQFGDAFPLLVFRFDPTGWEPAASQQPPAVPIDFDGTRARGVKLLDGTIIEASWVVTSAGT
jgi:hypothetical protein